MYQNIFLENQSSFYLCDYVIIITSNFLTNKTDQLFLAFSNFNIFEIIKKKLVPSVDAGLILLFSPLNSQIIWKRCFIVEYK